MRLRNLVQVLVFTPNKINVKGEYTTKWIYKGTAHLNKQQDLNELDRNSAGEVDYEIIKLHTDTAQDIAKGDGISFIAKDGVRYNGDLILYNGEPVLFRGMEFSVPPDYIVKSKPTIGKSTIYTCYINNEE